MDVAQDWRDRWAAISAEALERKDSQSALADLFDAYRCLRPAEVATVDAVIGEAVESTDETTRFDALALVREFRIASATRKLEATRCPTRTP